MRPTGRGEVVTADRVLSAADGRYTRTVLLGEDDGARFDPRRVSDQPVQVNLGVVRGLVRDRRAHLPAPPDAPSASPAAASPVLTVQNKHYDPHAAPAGKSALTVFLESDYAFWKALEADRPSYETEKRRCADLVIEAVGRHRPGFADDRRGRRRLDAAHA